MTKQAVVMTVVGVGLVVFVLLVLAVMPGGMSSLWRTSVPVVQDDAMPPQRLVDEGTEQEQVIAYCKASVEQYKGTVCPADSEQDPMLCAADFIKSVEEECLNGTGVIDGQLIGL